MNVKMLWKTFKKKNVKEHLQIAEKNSNKYTTGTSCLLLLYPKKSFRIFISSKKCIFIFKIIENLP